MHRKWKSVFALGMALLLGCLMPMHTMLAAEDDAEVVQEVEADSDADVVSDDGAISDDNESVDADENTGDEASAEDENAGDEANAEDENVGDEADAADVNVGDEAEADMDGQEGIQLMAVSEEPEAGGVEVQASTDAPVIAITLNEENYKVDGLGGEIAYKYTKSSDSKLKLSASQDGNPVEFYYYLDKNPGDTAMEENQINWSDAVSSLSTVVEVLSNNKTYVVYVKAEANGQTVYARSCGIVVDTIAPKIVGVEAGKTYSPGTPFTVEDANLDVVMVNETPVTPSSDGTYQVKANGTNCMIRAKDKAGNEQTCSITVFGEEPEDNTVISKSGTYSLKPGVSYQLTAGKWKVGGDSTVYQGGRSFYVSSSGDYSFTKQ